MAVTQEEMAGMSIEEIEAAALKQLEGNDPGDETGKAGGGEGDPMLDAGAKQDVTQVSSDPAAAEKTQAKQSDKELNFAALRTKVQKTEEELHALREENKRLASRGVFEATLPEDHAQRMVEVDGEISNLGNQFQNGDITWEEHQRLMREVSAKRDELLDHARMVKISQEMKRQSEQKQAEDNQKSWSETVDSFIKTKPDGIDYAADEAKNRDLDIFVKALAAHPDNGDKDFKWFITEAHRLVKGKHGIAGAPASEKNNENSDQTSNDMPFNTLSDLPGGSLAARNEVEQIADISGAALANKFMNDPSKIDQYLASLG